MGKPSKRQALFAPLPARQVRRQAPTAQHLAVVRWPMLFHELACP